jgi:site-specific DNA-methyltransferase (adenine-specific)
MSTVPFKVDCQDAGAFLGGLEPNSVHAMITDIPYGIAYDDWDVLHSNTNSALLGSSPAQARAGAIFKSRGKPINGWSEADREMPKQYYDWCRTWLPEAYKALKPGASLIVFAGRRFSHRFVSAAEDSGFSLKDQLAWMRSRAPHRAQRVSVVFDRRGDTQNAERVEGWKLGNLGSIFEPIVWMVKPYVIGTTITDNLISHEVGGCNEAGFQAITGTCDNILNVISESSDFGLHPTQKPVRLMQALVELVTLKGQVIVDPFCGSGSTGIAAIRAGRSTYLNDVSDDYCRLARTRLEREFGVQADQGCADVQMQGRLF